MRSPVCSLDDSVVGDAAHTAGPFMAGPVKLCASNLGVINRLGLVSVPTYSREMTQDRNLIFHLGVGGFHRSHQAYYLHELMGRGENWGLVGVGILPFDKPMLDALSPQDFLYCLMSRGSSGFGCCVVGSILDYIYAPNDVTAAVERMASPQVREPKERGKLFPGKASSRAQSTALCCHTHICWDTT
jgi:mannitol 2-dehydrogenase